MKAEHTVAARESSDITRKIATEFSINYKKQYHFKNF
jgi:hypothetical protein